MKQQGHFLLLDRGEFLKWLAGQKITRLITRLQVHHTAAPNYSTRQIVDGVAKQDHFAALEGMRDFHVKTNGWSATGQNITVFEDGKIAISLDRGLNSTPAGIAGANTGALCVEIIGNFDKGEDIMTDAQREAVTHLYACLCEKLGITPGVTSIVYHAWYKADSTWLGDYTAGRSSKTCPGTNFWGAGNTKAAALKGFIPDVIAELSKLKSGEDEDEMTAQEKKDFETMQVLIKEQAEVTLGLTNRVIDLEKRLNTSGKETYYKGYIEAIEAAKGVKAITSYEDKSKLELNIIQLLFNLGLFKKGVK